MEGDETFLEDEDISFKEELNVEEDKTLSEEDSFSENDIVERDEVVFKDEDFYDNHAKQSSISFYTVKIKAVDNPNEGIRFLSNVRDEDPLWEKYPFHLYKNNEDKSFTNICIGKFNNLESASKVVTKLKNKGMKSAEAIKFEDKILSSNEDYVKNNSFKDTRDASKSISYHSNNKLKKSSNTQNVEIIKNEDKQIPVNKVSSNVSDIDNFFTVQIASVREITSEKIKNVNISEEDLFYSNISNFSYALNCGKYQNYELAHKKSLKLKENGFEGVFVAKYINNIRSQVAVEDLKSEKLDLKAISKDMKLSGYKPFNKDYAGKYIQIGSFFNWSSHAYDELFKRIDATIYYKVDSKNSVKFLVGPYNDRDVYIEFRKIKNIIPDAFIKTL